MELSVQKRRPPAPVVEDNPDLEPIDSSIYDGHDPTRTRWKSNATTGSYSFIAFRPAPPPTPPPPNTVLQQGSLHNDNDDDDDLDLDDSDLALPELTDSPVLKQQGGYATAHGLITPPTSPPPQERHLGSGVITRPPSPPSSPPLLQDISAGITKRFSLAFMRGTTRPKTIGTVAIATSSPHPAPNNGSTRPAQKVDEWHIDPDEKPRTTSGKIRWEDDRDSWF